ncbi:response regulator [Paenibacillus piri]|uniref:Response regulator n=1 Tax=Paenibacillus piri TaxID=2547395 RepID=A0A4R5KR50_9BACL|nr:response regulator [Paenibacillus piri]TDF98066.1 response regulator [Paenibacillus piri]
MFHLLIVDDHPAQVDSLAHTVSSLDGIGISRISKAYSGYEALELISMHPIDIVITDIRMPEMNGLQLIEKVRSTATHLPQFIILSGYADFEYAKQAIEYRITRYLMKPVDTGELREILISSIEELNAERQRKHQFHQSIYTLRENYPLLRGSLLQELVEGRSISREAMVSKLERLELSFQFGDAVIMMLIRPEDGLIDGSMRPELSLMEYAVTNLTEDIFGSSFYLWSFKDVHGYLVYILKRKLNPDLVTVCSDGGDLQLKQLENAAVTLKLDVRRFLKGSISILLIPQWVSFPGGLPSTYQFGISVMRRRIGEDKPFYVAANDDMESPSVHALRTLYEPPMLHHLMDAGKWEHVEQRVKLIFEELSDKWRDSPEILNEAFYGFAGAFNYISHRNGKRLSDIVSKDAMQPNRTNPFHTLQQLERWVRYVLEIIRDDLNPCTHDSRRYAIDRVTDYIHQHLDQDLSLQTIADRVGLHPVYLSKLFKSETGEGFSDYILKCRMERAAALLKDNKLKVYHIANLLGYQTSHYFIKVFKKFYGLTPQEFKCRHYNGIIMG